MLEFLHRADHFPGCGKYGFFTLLLPKLNIELPVWRVAAHDSGLQSVFAVLVIGHGSSSPGTGSGFYNVRSLPLSNNGALVQNRLRRSGKGKEKHSE